MNYTKQIKQIPFIDRESCLTYRTFWPAEDVRPTALSIGWRPSRTMIDTDPLRLYGTLRGAQV
jgi:hypothetical protein